MGNEIFSKCGMRCDLCLIYRPNVEKTDSKLKNEINKEIFNEYIRNLPNARK